MKTINEYFSQDEKISLISEYLLSKKRNKIILEPKPGCNQEDISNWLEYMGVTEHYRFSGAVHIPNKDCLIYEIGPGPREEPGYYWVALIGNPKGKGEQRACAKPVGLSFFCDNTGVQTYMNFEKVIKIMMQMIDNPNKVIRL